MVKELISLVIMLAKWFFGKKLAREQAAREIAAQFKRVERDGDSLFDQVWEEMGRQSDVSWDEIKIRREIQ